MSLIFVISSAIRALGDGGHTLAVPFPTPPFARSEAAAVARRSAGDRGQGRCDFRTEKMSSHALFAPCLRLVCALFAPCFLSSLHHSISRGVWARPCQPPWPSRCRKSRERKNLFLPNEPKKNNHKALAISNMGFYTSPKMNPKRTQDEPISEEL